MPTLMEETTNTVCQISKKLAAKEKIEEYVGCFPRSYDCFQGDEVTDNKGMGATRSKSNSNSNLKYGTESESLMYPQGFSPPTKVGLEDVCGPVKK